MFRGAQVASHLTVISGNSGASASSRAFAGQQAAAQDATTEPGGLLGLFAALLDNGSKPVANAATAPTTGNADLDLAGLFRLGLEGDLGDS